jgi:hypothetical protein
MASAEEHDVIITAQGLFRLIDRLIATVPASAEAAAVRAAAERHDQALRLAGYEVGRPSWMRA